MGRLFGTDGIRGVANVDLTPELAVAVGRAAGWSLEAGPVLVGRDPRRSGEMLSLALQAGFHSAGVDTIDVGILPSGGISFLTGATEAEMGAIVSASHNPAADNGIKLLDRRGAKLPDSEEDRIAEKVGWEGSHRIPVGAKVGTRFPMADAADRYVEWLVEPVRYSFRGIELVLDCANGAAFRVAPDAFRRLGASVDVHCDIPDGVNINAGCGSTHPEYLQGVIDGRIGLAFDGDADRLIAVDEKGRVVDGDRTMAICVRHWLEAGLLTKPAVVVTVMTNLGFKRAMAELGVEVIETRVGDRYVLEAMQANQVVIGGEQSGHVIFLDRARTGDGILTGIRLLEVVAATGRPLWELSDEAMESYPQVLINVPVEDRHALEGAEPVWEEVRRVERLLGEEGRVLVRASGTENVVRVMVEAAHGEVASRYAEELAAVVGRVLGKEESRSP
ncbi:MAG: phosphoglucosamine mutase [Acidimicrobiia bacterium]|nr:MAG: phosphoglucosamine mutase [Acidimicrobiia bacterium]